MPPSQEELNEENKWRQVRKHLNKIQYSKCYKRTVPDLQGKDSLQLQWPCLGAFQMAMKIYKDGKLGLVTDACRQGNGPV